MITLTQLADIFISDFSGGDQSKDSQLDKREVILKIRSYLNPILKLEYYGKMNEGDKSAITSAIASYEVNLSEDDAGQKYIDIPDFYMTLPHNKGLHRIHIKGNAFRDFIPVSNPGVSGELPHMKIKGLQYFYVEGKKAMMLNGCIASKADKIVLQLIVPAPDSLGDTDPLPLLKEHMGDVMARLKQDFAPMAMIPNDYANNQNKDIK